MCKATKDGGKRCGAHANATLAATMQISKLTGAPTKTVKDILAMLRKRGKGELAPSQEEVMKYAQQQKFIINNDTNLDSHDKKILSNRWDKAAKEEISGGTWYAIKRGFAAVVAFMKKRAVATGIIGVMAFSSVAACSGGVAPEQPTSPPTSVTAPATPTETTPTTVGKSITVGEKVGEGLNSRNELKAGDMSYLLDGFELPKDFAEAFTPEQIKAAQQTAAEFVIEEMVDSDFLHTSDVDAVNSWYDHIKPRTVEPFTSDIEQLKNNMSADTAPVPSNIGGWRGTPDPDRPTSTGAYYDDISVKLSEVIIGEHENQKFPGFVYEVTTKRAVLNTDKTDTKKYDEYTLTTAGVVVADADSGKIAGFYHYSDTKTVEQGSKPKF